MKRKSLNASLDPHDVVITNVISHSKIASAADVERIAIALCGRVNLKLFPASVGHCRITKTTQSIFRSGKLVVVGADSEKTAHIAAVIYTAAIRRELGIPAAVYNFVINNVVGNFRLPYGLNLNLLAADHQMTSNWDPENFPGCHYRPIGSSIAYVLFESGEGILTGGKSEKELHDSYTQHVTMFALYKSGAEYRDQDERSKRYREWFSNTAKKEKKLNNKNKSKKKKKEKEPKIVVLPD